MTKSTRNPTTGKPTKPYRDFPLFPHATRRWAKKIRGKLHYFGPWADPEGALQKYLDRRDDPQAGRTPRARSDELTVRDLVNRFLTSKRHLLDTREIVARTWQDYHTICARVVRVFRPERPISDLSPADFDRLRADFAKTRGPVALLNDITRVRVLFKFAYDAGLLAAPVRYGSGFRRPSKKTLRLAREDQGPKMFEAAEIRAVLDAAGVPLKAMVLLGCNAGFGNSDCAHLSMKALNVDAGWIDYRRQKTGIQRHVPLWPETVAALRNVLKVRPAPVNEADSDLVFITSRRQRWGKVAADNPIAKEMAKLLKKLGIQRPGRGFYSLRHTFATVGGETRDQVAVDAIMGHAAERDDMAAVYRERISDERLRAVTDYVRQWLYAGATEESPAGEGGKDLA